MTIGIIIHSKTGHTLEVAEKLKEALIKAGRSAILERIEARPDLSVYEALVFGSHTEGFRLAQDMSLYLASLGSLKQKPVALLITHAFPLPGMGGSQAMTGLKNQVEKLGGQVVSEAVIDWSRPGRARQIEAAITRMTGQL